MKKIINHNRYLLDKFIEFCGLHPELRFWQALSAWVKSDILVGDEDPFYWRGKRK